MYDIWINEIMTEEQQKRTQLAERYNEQTMGRADKDYEYILLMNPFVSTPDLRKFITHQAAATDPRDIDQETYGRKPTGKRYWKRNIQRQRTITLYEQKAEDSATSGTRQRLSRGTAAKDFDFIVDTGATDTTVPDHLIGQTEYATTLRQTDKPIIVQASNGGTDLKSKLDSSAAIGFKSHQKVIEKLFSASTNSSNSMDTTFSSALTTYSSSLHICH